jgi:hypothetical protein
VCNGDVQTATKGRKKVRCHMVRVRIRRGKYLYTCRHNFYLGVGTEVDECRLVPQVLWFWAACLQAPVSQAFIPSQPGKDLANDSC